MLSRSPVRVETPRLLRRRSNASSVRPWCRATEARAASVRAIQYPSVSASKPSSVSLEPLPCVVVVAAAERVVAQVKAGNGNRLRLAFPQAERLGLPEQTAGLLVIALCDQRAPT